MGFRVYWGLLGLRFGELWVQGSGLDLEVFGLRALGFRALGVQGFRGLGV